MNINELVYDLKEHLDTYCQTYDDYILTYNQTEMIYYLINDLQQENQELKKQLEEKENQQKEFIDWLTNESKELIRDAGYHQRICLDILSKYKEITGKDINVSSKNQGDTDENRF